MAEGTANSLVSAHDIVVVCEAHLSGQTPDDAVALPGFTVFRADRAASASRPKFGGVAVYIRDHLVSGVEFLRKDRACPGVEILWLRLHFEHSTCLLSACYLAPESSAVYGVGSDKDAAAELAFGHIQKGIMDLRSGSDEVLVVGDLNARVCSARVHDFPDVQSLSSLAELGLTDFDAASYDGIEVHRQCQDNTSNTFGLHLGDLCRACGLLICNGRVAGDADGRLTFPTPDGGGSMIDLFVASPGLLKAFTWMRTGELLWCDSQSQPVSDHRPVTAVVALTMQQPAPRPEATSPGRRRIAFDVAKWREYAKLFTPDDAHFVLEAEAVAEQLGAGVIDSTAAVQSLSKSLSKAFATAFRGLSAGRATAECPWWNDACRASRDRMFSERVRAGNDRASPAWPRFLEARRLYNLAKRQAKAEHEECVLRDFLRTCRHDQKQLWRLLDERGKGVCAIDDMNVWTQHFNSLLNPCTGGVRADAVEAALSFINTRSMNVARDVVWREHPEVRQRCAAAADILNSPVSLEEVVRAIAQLPNGKSPGNELVPGECFKYARRLRQQGDDESVREYNRLAPVLRVLLDHIFTTGDFPEQFTTTLVTPVPKKGDPTVPGNYRGIAVGGALAKLYAAVLLHRLVMAGEVLGLRHKAQAGFRHRYGTVHHLFVKRVLTERHQRPGSKPLIVVQIDFEKAFDRVDREALWLRLQERGVQGHMLMAIQKAYAKVEMRVKANGQKGPPFLSGTGVKQGDPLSTELFGLFIEVLGNLIDAYDDADVSMHPTHAPLLGSELISLLFYADDISLLATSPERMRELLSYVDFFCEVFGMKANVKKCERLVFADSPERAARVASRCESLALKGERIPPVEKARYLGLVYGPGSRFCACRDALLDSARKAMFGLLAKLDKRKIFAPDVRMRTFDTQVRSILLYGCEVWGPDMLADLIEGGPAGNRSRDSRNLAEGWFEAAIKDPAVRLQLSFMRRTAGAASPAHRLLFAELAQLPLHYFALKLLVGFVNRIQKQPNTYCHAALSDELRDAILVPHGDGWGAKFLRVLSALHVDIWSGLPAAYATTPADKVKWLLSSPLPVGIVGAMRAKLMSAWDHERLLAQPGGFPSDGFMPGIQMAKYKCWMGLMFCGHAPIVHTPHLACSMRGEAHRRLMRFRMCCWPIAANRAHGIERHLRVCPVCQSGAVEDEKHVLCDCPAYAHLRSEAQLPQTSILNIMRNFDQVRLASLLLDIWALRNSTVPFGR